MILSSHRCSHKPPHLLSLPALASLDVTPVIIAHLESDLLVAILACVFNAGERQIGLTIIVVVAVYIGLRSNFRCS